MGQSLSLVRRNSAYYVRLRVPADLRKPLGRTEIKRSLGTLPYEEARLAALTAGVHIRHLFRTWRREAVSGADAVRTASNEVIERFFREALEPARVKALSELEALRAELPAIAAEAEKRLDIADLAQRARDRGLEGEALKAIRDRRLEALDAARRGLRSGDYALVEQQARDRLKQEGFTVPEDSAEAKRLVAELFFDLCRHLQEAHVRHLEVALERDEARLPASAPAPPVPLSRPAPVVQPPVKDPAAAAVEAPPDSQAAALSPAQAMKLARSRMTPRELLAEYAAVAKPNNLDDYVYSIRLFEQIVGAKPVSQVTEDDIVYYCTRLLDVPARFETRLGTDDALEAIRRNKARQDPFPTISKKTITDKRLANVRSLMNWAAGKGYARHFGWAVLAREVTPAFKEGRGKPRHAFGEEQLRRIFACPVFTECAGPGRWTHPPKVGHAGYKARDWHFWAPLILLFTGARVGEVAQLGVNSIETLHGHPCFRFTTAPDPDEQMDKTLKTLDSIRSVPIHRELIRIGFLEFVADMKARGSARLFPDWKPTGKGYSISFGKFFNDQLLVKMKAKTKQHSAHSLRHGMLQTMTRSGIPEDVQNLICGWTSDEKKSEKGRTGKSAYRTLEAIHVEQFITMTFEGLDLSHISYR